MSYLVHQQPQVVTGTIRKFEPAYWDVNMNLECACTIITTGADSFRVKATFISNHDFIGINWRSIDKWDHPLFAYRTSKDYTNCVLQFQLDYNSATFGIFTDNGPVITVIDLAGNSYFVRIANYAVGTNFSALVTLDFNTVMAGFIPNIPVPWDAIEYMFIGLGSTSYDPGAPLAPITEAELVVDVTAVTVTGANDTIGIGDTGLAVNELAIADGYGDSYPLTPERIVRQLVKLGYDRNLNIYVGFDHFNSLTWDAGAGDFKIDITKPMLNLPTEQWFFDYAQRLAAAGLSITISVSFELLDRIMPADWAQRDYNNSIGRSGWDPPSSFVSPCSAEGQAYLQDLSLAFVTLCQVAGCLTLYQVGEPWWWDGSYGNTGPCFYDADTEALYTDDTGLPVPTPKIVTIYDEYQDDPDQVAYLTWLQQALGNATLNLAQFVKEMAPGTDILVLFYTPTVLNPLSPMLTLVNFPQTLWARPAWDQVQVEDYQVVQVANWYQNVIDMNVPSQSLGYPVTESQYFSGFNLLPQTHFIWQYVDRAIWYAEQKQYNEVMVWARPQVCRDGFVFDHSDWPTYETIVAQPAYAAFPVLPSVGFSVLRSPAFNTAISQHVSGREIRSPEATIPQWEYELRYEVLKSTVTDNWYQKLFSFFQDMEGKNGLFTFSDPEFATLTDHPLGTGDGYRRDFAIYRTFGGFIEPVLAVSGGPTVKVNGVTKVVVADYVLAYNDGYPVVRFNIGDEPPLGQAVTITMSPLFVCQFSDDTQTYDEFVKNLHSAEGVKFRTAKP